MSSPITPMADNVVAQLEEASNQTASGLYLPDNATEKPKTAKVVAVGKKVTDVNVGDRIIYKSYSSTDIKLDGQDYLIVKAEDILATVK
ncbi:co-chaperone GroES [Candidatus Saccharibacteria bacterium]|jgi:chaperonin GroES|nr:co-chaperone GroES [Candidatus Saccharibacteria bacterium]MBP7835062.1 co-chaperone GroES [Candidatus Saccharibacteria bacterium]